MTQPTETIKLKLIPDDLSRLFNLVEQALAHPEGRAEGKFLISDGSKTIQIEIVRDDTNY